MPLLKVLVLVAAIPLLVWLCRILTALPLDGISVDSSVFNLETFTSKF